MFAVQDVLLEMGFQAARSRLVSLTSRGTLAAGSQAAYEQGLATLIRVGPLGDVPGTTKLVRVLLLDPIDRDGTLSVGLRWEATGVAGGLFPILDGDIVLSPERAGARLALNAVYRPPLGRAGAWLDTAILHKVADATINALLHSIAEALTSPAVVYERITQEPGRLQPRPATELGMP